MSLGDAKDVGIIITCRPQALSLSSSGMILHHAGCESRRTCSCSAGTSCRPTELCHGEFAHPAPRGRGGKVERVWIVGLPPVWTPSHQGPAPVPKARRARGEARRHRKLESLTERAQGPTTMAEQGCKHGCCFCTPTYTCTRGIVVLESCSSRASEPGETDGQPRHKRLQQSRAGPNGPRPAAALRTARQSDAVLHGVIVVNSEPCSAELRPPQRGLLPAPRHPPRHASSRASIQTALSNRAVFGAAKTCEQGDTSRPSLDRQAREWVRVPVGSFDLERSPHLGNLPGWARSREYVPSHRLSRPQLFFSCYLHVEHL